MNITVIIPAPLQAACEGRATIQLGLPANASVADVLLTLVSLYPRLKNFVVDDRKPKMPYFGVSNVGPTVVLFYQDATRTGAPEVR